MATYGFRNEEFDPRAAAYMSGQGRRPTVRGFRSRPGAPLNIGGSMTADIGNSSGQSNSLTPESSWRSFFGPGPATASPGTATPVPSSGELPEDQVASLSGQPSGNYLGNVISNAASYLSSAGVSVPPFRAPDRSWSPAPYMPQSPSMPFSVPQPMTSPTGNAGTDASNLASNLAMYAPGGARFFRSAPQNPGWVSTNQSDLDRIASRYGNTRLRYNG